MKVLGEGSVTQLDKGVPRSRCRKWRLRVQTSDGERTRRFAGTYKEARKALASFAAELATPVGTMTFAQYADVWLGRRVRSGDYAPQTLKL